MHESPFRWHFAKNIEIFCILFNIFLTFSWVRKTENGVLKCPSYLRKFQSSPPGEISLAVSSPQI